MRRNFRTVFKEQEKHLYLTGENAGKEMDQSYCNALLSTYVETRDKYDFGTDGFSALMYMLLGLRKASRNSERIILTRSVAEMSLKNPPNYFVKPDMPNGCIYIETQFDSYNKNGEHIDAVMLIDRSTFEIPDLMGGGVVSNEGFAILVLAGGNPTCSLEIPSRKYMFDDICRIYSDNPEKGDEMTVVIATLIALEHIRNGLYERKTQFEAKVKMANPSKRAKKLKKKTRVKKGRPVNNRVITFTHKDSEPKTTKEVSENVESKERSSFTYTPRNTSSHFKKRWVSLDYADKLENQEDLIDIQPITKELKAGTITRDMALVKVWYEYKHDPSLESSILTKKYQA